MEDEYILYVNRKGVKLPVRVDKNIYNEIYGNPNYRLCILSQRESNIYVHVHKYGLETGKKGCKTISLARYVLYFNNMIDTYLFERGHPEKGKVVDHINHNTLDNRLSNLRYCTQADNLLNRGRNLKKDMYLPKGISKTKYGKYVARFKGQHLGSFDNLKDAIHCYNKHGYEHNAEYFYSEELPEFLKDYRHDKNI